MSFHIVICQAGECREHVDGREMCDATREAVINDLISGEYSKPLRVLAIYEMADSSGVVDVSYGIAIEILQRMYERGLSWDKRRDLLNFVQTHAGMAAANEIMQAAE